MGNGEIVGECAICGAPIDAGSNGKKRYCGRRCWMDAKNARERARRPTELLKRLPASRGFTPEDRFWSKVAKTEGGCWLWTAGGTHDGYGLFHPVSGTKVYAHRWSWEQANGPIPAGLHVRHDCDTPSCVNPGHLRLGTARDNAQDAVERGRTNLGKVFARATHCNRGHEFNEVNALLRRDGHWSCRVCRRMLYARQAA